MPGAGGSFGRNLTGLLEIRSIPARRFSLGATTFRIPLIRGSIVPDHSRRIRFGALEGVTGE